MSRRALRAVVAFAAIASLVALDLGTKSWAASDLKRGGARTVVDGHLMLRYQENTGAAFNFMAGPGAGKRLALVGVSGAAAVLMAIALVGGIRRGVRGALLVAGLCALLAGTLGNLVDRASRGWVVDFIEWRVAGRWRWPTFNVADVAISVGIGLLLLHWLQSLRRRPAAPTAVA